MNRDTPEKTQLSDYDRRFLAALDLRMSTVADEVRLLEEGID